MINVMSQDSDCNQVIKVATNEHKENTGGKTKIKSVSSGKLETLVYKNKDETNLNPEEFFIRGRSTILNALGDMLKKDFHQFLLSFALYCQYGLFCQDDMEMILEIKPIQTGKLLVQISVDIEKAFEINSSQILTKMSEFQKTDNLWTLITICYLELRINKCRPSNTSTFLRMPETLAHKKACINVQNDDEYCFKWALISALYPVEQSHRPSQYEISDIESDIISLKNDITLNFKGMKFPLKLKNIKIFEDQNDLSINVFGFDEEIGTVIPYYCTTNEKELHINLLLIENKEKSHYVWIKNISRLLRAQITQQKKSIKLCNMCLKHFTNDCLLQEHKSKCKRMVTVMPLADKAEKTRTIFHKKMSDLMEFKAEIDELDIEEFTCNSPDELSEVEDIKPTIEDIEIQNQDNNSTENQTRVVNEPIEEDPINKQSNEISELKLEVQQLLQNQKVILARLAQIITHQESLVTIVTGNNDMLQKNYKMLFKKPYVLRFPLKTDYDLKEINEILKSDERENTITLMSNMLAVGGLQGNFSKIMDTNLIMRYNYDGSKGKCALRSYGALIDALFEATYKDGRSKKDMVDELRKVFKTLKNRIHKQEWRKKYRKDEDSYDTQCNFVGGDNVDNNSSK